MGKPEISVVTAALAEDVRFLNGIRTSIQSQQGVDWEWIIHEDGPTDKWRVAESPGSVFFGNSPRSHGVAIARNLAIARSRAAIIRNLDADDQLTDGALGLTVDIFERHPEVTYVVGPMIDLFEDGSTSPFDEILCPGPIPPGSLYRLWVEQGYVGPVHPTTLAVRRDALVALGGYAAFPISEDTAVLLALSRISVGWFTHRPVTIHRKRPGSLTAQDWSQDPRQRELRYKLISERCDALARWSVLADTSKLQPF